MLLPAGLVLAYLAGSFPTAYLAGRARGVDLGAVGSGNYGATNVFRNLGAGPAALVVAVDLAKGLLPVLLIPRAMPMPGLSLSMHQVLLAIAAVLGHVFSIFLRFRGGKGIATAGGAYLALAPVPTLVAALAWVAVVLATRIVSLASLTAAVVLLAGVLLREEVAAGGGWVLAWLTVAIVALVFWTHRENIGRLQRGEERRIAVGRSGGDRR
ncbi:MAG TPA: glycerol-3-phosphate 1-O-acyltransferase PlsY [Gemmatimonadota bacterium]|nr:glycerol-3-phosphate 1-O-acyltransferase PlsY [Gemmatimonadota bacterium]